MTIRGGAPVVEWRNTPNIATRGPFAPAIDNSPTNGVKEGRSSTTVSRSKGKDPLWNRRTFPYCAALYGARKSYLCVMIGVMIGSTHMWPLLAESNRIRCGRSIVFIPTLFFQAFSCFRFGPCCNLYPGPLLNPWTLGPLDPWTLIELWTRTLDGSCRL